MNNPDAEEEAIEDAEILLDSLRESMEKGKFFYICKTRPALTVPRNTLASQSDQTKQFEEKVEDVKVPRSQRFKAHQRSLDGPVTVSVNSPQSA